MYVFSTRDKMVHFWNVRNSFTFLKVSFSDNFIVIVIICATYS